MRNELIHVKKGKQANGYKYFQHVLMEHLNDINVPFFADPKCCDGFNVNTFPVKYTGTELQWFDSQSGQWTSLSIGGTPNTQMSITSDGAGLKLVNDVTNPGNYKSYSTDGSGAKGWNSTIFGTGTVDRLSVFSGNTSTLTASRVNQYALGVGGIGVDDLTTGVTTLNPYLLVLRNSYNGDGSASQAPMVLITTDSTSATTKNYIGALATGMPINSTYGSYFGRTLSTRNAYFKYFTYIGSGSIGNYVEDAFFAVPNLQRLYASGNKTLGNGVTADNGFRFEIDTTLKVGTKLHIGTPANPSIGTATLVGGTVTVNTAAVTASSKIFITCNTPGGTQGFLSVPVASIVAGTSFVINSSSGADTSTVNWWIIN